MPPDVSCSSCHSQQAVPALPQQLHSQRCLSGTRHARFLHPASRTSSERAQELPTVPIFVTEKVHVSIERNRAMPTKWRTHAQAVAVDAWAVHGIWWIGRKASKKCAAGATRSLSWIFRSIYAKTMLADLRACETSRPWRSRLFLQTSTWCTRHMAKPRPQVGRVC